MARPPQIWRSPFTVSTIPAPNSAPVVVQLENGNIVVAWTAGNAAAPADPAGNDVLAQIIDPLGNPVGTPFRINSLRTAHDEELPAIVALPGGGFAVAYGVRAPQTLIQRPPLLVPTLSDNGAMIAEVFDAAGALVRAVTLASLTTATAPAVAALSASAALALWVRPGNADVLLRPFNPETGAAGTAVTVFDGETGTGEGIGGVAIAASPTQNRYAVAYVDTNASTNDRLVFEMYDAAGSRLTLLVPAFPVGQTLANARTLANAAEIRDPGVAVLGNGQVVVTWTEVSGGNADARWLVLEAQGGGTLNPRLLAGGTGTQDQATVAPVGTAGFIAFWYDWATADVMGRYYRWTGDPDPVTFRVADYATTTFSAAGTLIPGAAVAACRPSRSPTGGWRSAMRSARSRRRRAASRPC